MATAARSGSRPGHAKAVLQVFDGVPDCQKDHRGRESEGPDPLAGVQTVHRRITELDVQDDQVRMRLLRLVDGLVAISGFNAVEAVVFEGRLDERANLRVVVYQ